MRPCGGVGGVGGGGGVSGQCADCLPTATGRVGGRVGGTPSVRLVRGACEFVIARAVVILACSYQGSRRDGHDGFGLLTSDHQ